MRDKAGNVLGMLARFAVFTGRAMCIRCGMVTFAWPWCWRCLREIKRRAM